MRGYDRGVRAWPTWDRYRVVERRTDGVWPVPLRQRASDFDLYERAGVPFVLDPRGGFDPDLNSFWTSSSTLLAASTLNLYAHHLARFLDFVWHARSLPGNRRNWRAVGHEDRLAYNYWRNEDPAGPRIAASTWNNEVTAVAQFYAFQRSVGNLNATPIRLLPPAKRARDDQVRQTENRPAELRRSKLATAPWLTPSEYRSWRDVGVRGFRPDGRRDPASRSQQTARNAAFTDLMFGVGLRLTEQASLLVAEVPNAQRSMYSRLILPDAVAKNRSGREVLVAERALRAVELYVQSDRADAVRSAQANYRYESVRDKLVLDEQGTFRSAPGRRVRSIEASPTERSRLYRETPDGLEPAALWLRADGLPMRPRTWQGIFSQANSRAIRFGLDVECNPHKLRHSWATITLAQLQRRYNKLRGESERAALIGDPLNWVSRRLGHRRIETTMVYIHNLAELETETILRLIPDREELVATPPGRETGTNVFWPQLD